MNYAAGIEELVGKTPLVALHRLAKNHGLSAPVFVKLERQNPAGSAKDRVALEMILCAEREGKLSPGGMIIEPTSGNTGVGLAAIGAARGYKVVLTMPDTMSIERRQVLAAYGATVVLTEGAKGMSGAIEKAKELHEANPGSILAGQFENPANPAAHYHTTGPEIWADTDGKVDIFVAGAGTGGTITGTGRYLREQNPNVKLVAVEPAASPLLSGGKAGPHGLQGIGANFVPEVLDLSLIDEIMPITDEDAYQTGCELARSEGLLCGITSGAAVYAAIQLAKRPENAGKIIVALLPDLGDRYLTTTMFQGGE